MFRFSDIVEIQGETEGVTAINISDGKEITENVNYKKKNNFLQLKIP